MKIEAVDLFYLTMPEVLDIGDGSQDALLVRVRAGADEGWGECEAAPLPSIASFVCPMSHAACKPVGASVLGERLDAVADIARISRKVRDNSFDLLQTDHTLSGIEMALWDLIGRREKTPVWALLGYRESLGKRPYASVLFGDRPDDTLRGARAARAQGFSAAKFGWGPFGKGSARDDADQIHAAREGLGPDGLLMVDAGTAFGEDVDAARARMNALAEARATWFEEPFENGALSAYAALATDRRVALAGGEECHNVHQARHMIDHGGVRFIQIDTGRIGGIGPAKQVAEYAAARKITFVNHTFTSHLALAASLAPFAGLPGNEICEYPAEPKALARDLTTQRLLPDRAGLVRLSDAPGLGVTPDLKTVRQYLVEVEIKVQGKTLYQTPTL